MTDEHLDKRFWFIDHDGIPRFKSEKGTIVRLPDLMDALIGIIDADDTELSLKVAEGVRECFGRQHGSSD